MYSKVFYCILFLLNLKSFIYLLNTLFKKEINSLMGKGFKKAWPIKKLLYVILFFKNPKG